FSQNTFAQQNDRNCQPNRLCVFPGDYLKYSTDTGLGSSGNLTYNFKGYVSDHEIGVQVTFVCTTLEVCRVQKVTAERFNKVMDLKTGLLENSTYQGDEAIVSSIVNPYSLFKIS